MNTLRRLIGLLFTYGAVMALLSPTDRGFFGDMGFNMGDLVRMLLVFLGVL